MTPVTREGVKLWKTTITFSRADARFLSKSQTTSSVSRSTPVLLTILQPSKHGKKTVAV